MLCVDRPRSTAGAHHSYVPRGVVLTRVCVQVMVSRGTEVRTLEKRFSEVRGARASRDGWGLPYSCRRRLCHTLTTPALPCFAFGSVRGAAGTAGVRRQAQRDSADHRLP
eukprot:COSAG06_NODE_8651_length_2106_cov_1.233682_1_plen_109_part_10